MKVLKFFTLALIGLSFNTLVANTLIGPDPTIATSKKVALEIADLFKDAKIFLEDKNAVVVNVVFSLNEEGQIDIRNIKTENKEIKKFIQERMDGKFLSIAPMGDKKFFTVPVKIIASQFFIN